MRYLRFQLFPSFLFILLIASVAFSQECVECHRKVTPRIVSDWELSKHSIQDVACPDCHGNQHKFMVDFERANLPTPDTCATCHENRVNQFKAGKHAVAWAAMKAMPTIHWQPMAMIEGMKGCGGCHKIGLKSEAEIKELEKDGAGFGRRLLRCLPYPSHLLTRRSPAAPGLRDLPHGLRPSPVGNVFRLEARGAVPAQAEQNPACDDVAAPTCQTCHMQEGNHEVRTAWGFLAVRLAHARGQAMGRGPRTILKGSECSTRRKAHGPAGRGQGSRRGAPDAGGLAEGTG